MKTARTWAVVTFVIGSVSIIIAPFSYRIADVAPAIFWFFVPLATTIIGTVFSLKSRETWLIVANLIPLVIGFPSLWLLWTLLYGP